jgi:acetyl-CoA C-acetyltransferase
MLRFIFHGTLRIIFLLIVSNRYGHQTVNDAIVKDGLTDAFDNIHMGVCAEETSADHGISRQVQDEHCKESYTRAANAWKAGAFEKEIAPVVIKGRKGDVVVKVDEEFTNIDFGKLSKLKGAFVKDGSGL